jgi:hypothetical protein
VAGKKKNDSKSKSGFVNAGSGSGRNKLSSYKANKKQVKGTDFFLGFLYIIQYCHDCIMVSITV